MLAFRVEDKKWRVQVASESGPPKHLTDSS